jgi:hypothetical protein
MSFFQSYVDIFTVKGSVVDLKQDRVRSQLFCRDVDQDRHPRHADTERCQFQAHVFLDFHETCPKYLVMTHLPLMRKEKHRKLA